MVTWVGHGEGARRLWKSSQKVEVKVRGDHRPGAAAVSLVTFPSDSRSPCSAGQ